MSYSEISRFGDDRPRNLAPSVWLVERILAGWSADAIAVAGGVSRRTAYRWVADVVAIETVVLGGYQARYAIRRGKPPARLEEWRRVES